VRALDLLEHDRFHFVVDFTPPSAGYLRNFQLFVLSSGWEAFPISILEALACGVPQVATDVGGTGEAMSSRTGVLVPAGDPAQLADAIIDLLRDPERRAAMAQASLERFEACYLLERMVAETDQVYRAVLEP
jgi:glycosyltransferase involved in cell wall biosynthesis